MSSSNTRQFLPKTAIHLLPSWGCPPGKAGPTSSFALWQRMVGQIPRTPPWAQIWRSSGELWCRCSWAVRLLRPPAADTTKPGRGQCQILLLGTRAGLKASCCLQFWGKKLSRILFPLLDPQAHFCGVKSHFPVLRMLHFPLLLLERPTKTNGENNWLNRKRWNLLPTKCWEKGQSKHFFWVPFNNLS